jgi:uncharacterized coiled-coil protein SlyX
MTDKERLDNMEERLAELTQKLDIADDRFRTMLARLTELEARVARVDARQERWLTLLGLTITDADQVHDLWQYPDLLRQQADLRQN